MRQPSETNNNPSTNEAVPKLARFGFIGQLLIRPRNRSIELKVNPATGTKELAVVSDAEQRKSLIGNISNSRDKTVKSWFDSAVRGEDLMAMQENYLRDVLLLASVYVDDPDHLLPFVVKERTHREQLIRLGNSDCADVLAQFYDERPGIEAATVSQLWSANRPTESEKSVPEAIAFDVGKTAQQALAYLIGRYEIPQIRTYQAEQDRASSWQLAG